MQFSKKNDMLFIVYIDISHVDSAKHSCSQIQKYNVFIAHT